MYVLSRRREKGKERTICWAYSCQTNPSTFHISVDKLWATSKSHRVCNCFNLFPFSGGDFSHSQEINIKYCLQHNLLTLAWSFTVPHDTYRAAYVWRKAYLVKTLKLPFNQKLTLPNICTVRLITRFPLYHLWKLIKISSIRFFLTEKMFYLSPALFLFWQDKWKAQRFLYLSKYASLIKIHWTHNSSDFSFILLVALSPVTAITPKMTWASARKCSSGLNNLINSLAIPFL